MNENIKLQMNASVKKQRSIGTSIALFSQDVDNYSFDITFTDLELQAGDQVEVLAKLQGGKLEHKSSANLVEVDGELIARYVFDTKLIDSEGHVFCYVYLKRGDKSADVGAFYFEADLSELDKVGGKIAEVYDGRYEDLVAGFEIRLQAYRDSLPQADSVRAEVDEVITQFSVDSQAKLNQYDDDVQQVIADNQTAFGLAESGRQNTYEQAEAVRNQSSNQAVTDWEQGADAIIEIVEGNESERVDAEATRKTAETDRVSSETTRKTNETTRISNEDARKSAEVIRLVSEVDRVNAEEQRKTDHANRSAEMDSKADKIVFKNLVNNGNFIDGVDNINLSPGARIENQKLVYAHGTSGSTIRNFTKRLNTDLYYVYIKYNTNETSNAYQLSNNQGNVYSINSSSTFHSHRRTYPSAAIISIYGGQNATHDLVVDYYVTLNLTETFGAGNEPTKEEMDELIKITGYIEEVTSIQILTWQLKLIRQNRNALIALGGTII